jgi:hypothetical protein
MQQSLPMLLFLAGTFAFSFAVLKISSKFKVKVEDADVPGQIDDIVKKVLPDRTGYKVVPAISKTSAGTMLKDTIKDKVLSQLTGHSVFTYEPNDKFVLIYGNTEMFFVPICEDLRKKEIKPILDKVTQISLEDLLNIKSNSSGSSITFEFKNKDKFLFGPLNEFYFKELPAKAEKEDFGRFVSNLENMMK